MTDIEIFTTPMLDGCKCGVAMEVDKVASVGLGTEVTAKEFQYLKRVFLTSLNGIEVKNATLANVYYRGKDVATKPRKDDYSSAKISCNVWKGRHYFNVEGNPISFLTGQNVLGVAHLAKILSLFYLEIERSVQTKDPTFSLPVSVKRSLDSLDIHVHRLAFACYTPELGLKDWTNMSRFFSAIDSIYAGYSKQRNQTVKEYFGIDVTRYGPYSLMFTKKDRVSKLWTLAMYNKAVELEEVTGKRAPEWTANRIRLDLTLHSTWFDRNRCKTLRELTKKFAGSYRLWIYSLISACLDETKVRYMLGFRTIGIDVGDYKKAFTDWSNGKEVSLTPGMQAWFEEQGLDLSIPLNIHEVAGYQRSIFNLADGTNSKAILGDKKDLLRLTSRFADGLNNSFFLPIAKRAHLLQPDVTFGRFLKQETKKGIVWIDTDTGEVLG